MSAALAKLAATLLTSEKGRKAVGWAVLAVCSPFILISHVLRLPRSGEQNGVKSIY